MQIEHWELCWTYSKHLINIRCSSINVNCKSWNAQTVGYGFSNNIHRDINLQEHISKLVQIQKTMLGKKNKTFLNYRMLILREFREVLDSLV